MPDSFVHLHNHTEYSMLDGAQKLGPMFAEVARQGMPAIAMSDHGSMFGAYEFAQVARDFDGCGRSSGSRRTWRRPPGSPGSGSSGGRAVDLPALNKRAVESLVKAGAFDSLRHTRKGLTAIHEAAVDAVIPVKKAASFGQDDLFAGLGAEAEGDGGSGLGLDFPVDETEWPRRRLLSTEREMLGLYVSAHPLDGAEHLLATARDCSVADLLASGRTGGEVRLAGLITGVQHKVTKQGNAWAVVNLVDRDAGIEVLFFPAVHRLVEHALAEDNVVSVTGRIEDRDGTLNVFGRELAVLDVSAAERGGGPLVRLALPARRINERSVAELKRMLADHPGDSPVHLSVRGARGVRRCTRCAPPWMRRPLRPT
ncbi:PHP domain-containing protein [Streptomyces sp. TRM68367]|uniref:PHP domain-containing protein n=1 Tax=Streptomyces sp. TRM68367 TaxID=2758415 RepID=UPI00165AD76F|nr:PHP domain-containing protein [Streptomyces sp. TRM68367]MBC9727479.1 PHP domain-containing protein [Streptomyces sp. TRM68367]